MNKYYIYVGIALAIVIIALFVFKAELATRGRSRRRRPPPSPPPVPPPPSPPPYQYTPSPPPVPPPAPAPGLSPAYLKKRIDGNRRLIGDRYAKNKSAIVASREALAEADYHLDQRILTNKDKILAHYQQQTRALRSLERGQEVLRSELRAAGINVSGRQI